MNGCPSLLVDLYELTMAECYFRYRKNTHATFDLFVRHLPENRSFLVFAGLDEIISFIRDFRFNPDTIAYLKSLRMFSDGFLRYLKALRFTGDILAMQEGTVFFPDEPAVRVTAPIIQAQLLEGFLLNAVNMQSMIASKAARVVLSARGRPVYDFSLRRTHGSDAAVKAARASYIAGCAGTSNVLAGKLYGIPVAGTMAHSFVMAFDRELESFKAYTRTFPSKSILLVDTFDTRQGIAHAITAGLELNRRGYSLTGIRLDSGDILSLSKTARRMLDAAGLDSVDIVASGNLDESSIHRLLQNGAPVDSFGVGTRMGTSFDAPALDVIYKLSEVSHDGRRFLPAMKLSRAKKTLPGRKQIFRLKDRNGVFIKDVLGLEHEKIAGETLLHPVVTSGRCVYDRPRLETVRARCAEQIACLPSGYKVIAGGPAKAYPVRLSPGLAALTAEVSRRFSRGQ